MYMNSNSFKHTHIYMLSSIYSLFTIIHCFCLFGLFTFFHFIVFVFTRSIAFIVVVVVAFSALSFVLFISLNSSSVLVGYWQVLVYKSSFSHCYHVIVICVPEQGFFLMYYCIQNLIKLWMGCCQVGFIYDLKLFIDVFTLLFNDLINNNNNNNNFNYFSIAYK